MPVRRREHPADVAPHGVPRPTNGSSAPGAGAVRPRRARSYRPPARAAAPRDGRRPSGRRTCAATRWGFSPSPRVTPPRAALS